MDITIISGGESRKDYKPNGNITIGINGVVTEFQCDYWLFLDYPVYEKYKPIGNPKIVTCGNPLKELPQAIEPNYARLPEAVKPVEYSLIAAISFAIDDCKCNKLTIIGDDKTIEESGNRTAKRWMNEIAMQSRIEAYYDISKKSSDIYVRGYEYISKQYFGK